MKLSDPSDPIRGDEDRDPPERSKQASGYAVISK
jgi:hypothetical protein